MPDLGGGDSTRPHQGTPQGLQTLIFDDMVMKPCGVPLDLVLVIKTLIGEVHPLKTCLWSIMIDSKTLVEGYASCNPNQGGFGPKA